MEYIQTEGMHNPALESNSPIGQSGKLDSLFGGAQAAIRITLVELSLLAGIVTVDTTLPSTPMSSQSPYSLLLDPAIFSLKEHSNF